MKEEWKDINGYKGVYKISNLGRLKSLHFGKERIRIPSPCKCGYFCILLQYKGNIKSYRIHRLVAEYFLPNKLQTVNHKNGIKTDNRAINLEWCTQSENCKHAYRTGLKSRPIGESHPNAKITEEQASEIKIMGVRFNAREISKKFNLSLSHISHIISGKRWGHLK